jgi:putative CocE/NonD family hydrolase
MHPRTRTLLTIGAITVAGVFSGAVVVSAPQNAFDVREHYDKAEYMVPMRDGVRLYTIVYTPKDTSRIYPIMLFRTPYSIRPYEPDRYRRPLGPTEQFDRDGYIFVFQDARGTYRSEGTFQVIRPLNGPDAGPTATDESTDNWDTIEWVLDNIPNHNGRVGQWGISYPGWQTVMGMVDAHPALVASSPQASPADMFIGDDWHHNGAFRLMYAFGWLSRNARRRDQPTEQRARSFDYGTPWGYDFFLDIGPVARINELFFHDDVPAWNEFMEHGTYDRYWQSQNALLSLDGITHPVLNVAGWFDAEDFYGPMSIYYTLEEENPDNQSTLVVGPWLHGGWRSMSGESLGCIDFGTATSETFRSEVQYPFFSRYLRDRGDWAGTEAIVFETGANRWRRFDRWPPRGIERSELYFGPNGTLSWEAPSPTSGPAGTGAAPSEDTARGNVTMAADAISQSTDAHFDSYISDPDRPVPFSAEYRTTQGHLWMIEDQRFAATRPDVLVYESEVLTEDVTIAGPIIATLYASTSGTDSDFIVKLIDVFPGDAPDNPDCPVPMGDFQMLLAGEVFRAKFRNSFQNPEPMVPDQPARIEFDLRDRLHTFRAGHRIMVQVQSSWFPVIDRNPQTFVDIYSATEDAFQAATQRVYRTEEMPSHLTLGVLRRD